MQLYLLMNADPNNTAAFINDTTLTGSPTLENGNQLFIQIAQDKTPATVMRDDQEENTTAGIRNAAMVLHESGNGIGGNGKKLILPLAQKDAGLTAQVLMDDQITAKDQTKYLNHLASKDMFVLKQVLMKIPEDKRSEVISHMDEKHLMKLRGDTDLMEHVPRAPVSLTDRFSASLRSCLPGSSKAAQQQEDQEMQDTSRSAPRV